MTSPRPGKDERGGRGGSLRAFASSDSLAACAAQSSSLALHAARDDGNGGGQHQDGDEEAAALLSRGASASAAAPAGPDQGDSGLSRPVFSSAVATAYHTTSSSVTLWLCESRAVLLGRELGGRALPALHTQVGPDLDRYSDLYIYPCLYAGNTSGLGALGGRALHRQVRAMHQTCICPDPDPDLTHINIQIQTKYLRRSQAYRMLHACTRRYR